MTQNNSVQISSVDEVAKIKNLSIFEITTSKPEQAGETFLVNDPATEDIIGQLPDMGLKETTAAIEKASEAYKSWSKVGARVRKEKILAWYELILKNKEDLARMITIECGKPYPEAIGEILYGASFVEWFAQEAIRSDGDTMPILTPSQRIFTIKQPVGVVGLITPWNFPNAMITRKAGAAIAAGCTAVIKPSPETPYSAIALKNLALQAGIPDGVINIVTTMKNVQEVGKELTTHPKIKKISFTGSTAVGKLLLSQASGSVKKPSMELGGNAPFIVFDDANINDAVDGLMICKFRNAGQTCVCANRIFVHSAIYDEFVSKAMTRMKETLKIGHGIIPGSTLGPVITEKAAAKMETILADAVSKGATVHEIIPESLKPQKGYFCMPKVLTDVNMDMVCAKEEIFGPICGIIKFDSEEDVLAKVNNVPVGLAGYFYSNNISRIYRVAEAIEVGMIGVNTGLIGSEVLPFGGVKESGLGREGSKYGLDEFLQIKSIVISI
ncbi:hypothetical protein BB558_005140 [Smittium angustum]|uniref:Succinate-semialdehyde dehydrogenase, mitochondrial n=1 Tax=Smittium angustum TaxID=133377 RepID=A0A2U1J1F8_SMIAN|nr:hypothetical protein BB558_005140 [Smittium angustum]